jgi:diguanylate cyclase (GGDEF)-like protein
MKYDFKLFTLPVIVLAALIYISFLFSSEITKLKDQIDNIYFGNFVPVHKLHNIKHEYQNIIQDQINYGSSKEIILENWKYYNNQYKTVKEREVVSKIDLQIKKSFKKNTAHYYQFIIKQLDLLIEYEVSSAYLQRKEFLADFNKVNTYLYYNQISIIVFLVIFIIIVVYNVQKHHNKLENLVHKYKSDSITDGLTGLYNRKYFDEILDDIAVVSLEHQWTSAFVMIDIDFFKQYNDTYGHDKGDEALKTVASTFDAIFHGEYDYVFRIGGEEFGLIIFDISQERLEKRLKELQRQIALRKIEHSASKTGYLTLSMGVMIIDDKTYSLSIKEIYNQADKKLYISKENGRDQYTI